MNTLTQPYQTTITADDVISKRQTELMSEIMDIDDELKELEERVHSLKIKRDEKIMEYDLFCRMEERNEIRITTTSTTVEIRGRRGRLNQSDKLSFEDVVKQIFDKAGRPMRISELIERLEKFGYKWSKYGSAFNYITTSHVVEKVARGYYQIIR